MIKAVIFDLDGLLIDSEANNLTLLNKILEPYGQKMDLKTYADNYCGRKLEVNMANFVSSYHLPISIDECVSRFIELVYSLKLPEPNKEGALSLLRYLKENNIPCVLATSSPKGRALNILEQNGLKDYFQAAVCGEDVSHSKPDPEVFLKAAALAKQLPEDCLVLEDSEAGIEAAYAGHIPVICVPDLRMPSKKAEMKTLSVLPSLCAVEGWLKQGFSLTK